MPTSLKGPFCEQSRRQCTVDRRVACKVFRGHPENEIFLSVALCNVGSYSMFGLITKSFFTEHIQLSFWIPWRGSLCLSFLRSLCMVDRVLGNEYRLGVSKIFSLRSKQRNNLAHKQRLHLKQDVRPCPRIKYKGRTSHSTYETYPWICGGEIEDGKSIFFCWPCLVMADITTVGWWFNFF